MDRRIVVIGGGRVTATLTRAMQSAGLPIVAVHSRDRSRAEEIARHLPEAVSAETAQGAADAGDVVFLAVSDDVIATVCGSLAWRADQSVVHCSGATELDALSHAAAAGAAVGAFHPLQMFANPAVALETLPGCTITIDAPDALAGELDHVCRRLGCRPLRLPPGRRALYHASANYVGPFVVALMKEAADIWRLLGASEREMLDALGPLVKGTAAAVMDGGLAGGMSGCVARGDVGTIERHLAALDALSPDMAALYRQLTLRTIPLAIDRGTLSADAAERIRRLMQGG